MDQKGKKNIADILLSEGLLTKEQVSQIKLENINTGRPIEDILLDRNFVTKEEIAKAKAKLFNVPYVKLADRPIATEILSKIPEPVARHYNLIPFDFQEGLLSVAMTDPLDLQVIEFLEAKSNCKIKPFLALASEITKAIEDQYSASIETEVQAALKETQTGAKEIEESIRDIEKVEEVIRDAPVARIVSTLLEYAVKSRASDVHIEPGEEKTRVRYRIDGLLGERVILPKKVHEAVISRVKILSNLKIDERRLPQDGRFQIKVGDQEVDLRVSTLPTKNGEKAVMRLLRKTGGVPTFPELGLQGRALKVFQEQLLRPHGVILVTGPTGSGKSTTLYSALIELNKVIVNIITLEDPVEYVIAGLNQVQINPLAGLTFASGLRSILRQDPDIIMVGEIRDNETAELGVHAALTGHLVLSTLHTNSASGSFPRLLDMHVEPFLIASTLNLAVAQRLTRRICEKCKKPFSPPEKIVEEVKKELGNLWPQEFTEKKKITLYKGEGCHECNESGFKGRVGIFEVLPMSDKIARLIMEHAPASVIEKQACEEGMISLKQDGFLKVLKGITSYDEVLRVAED